MGKKRHESLEHKWRRYLKDSRLLPEEQRKRAKLYASRGEQPPPEKEW